MNHLYVPQINKVRIILEPSELTRDYEKKIKSKLINTYGDSCYLNGFIKKSSIEIIKIENGTREGSHLHGFMTFNVEFSALFCIPKKDTIIPCLIKKINNFGIMAYAYPIDIIVPRQLQSYDKIETLKDLYEGESIRVKTLDYTIENKRLVVVGIITEFGLEKPNSIDLPQDGLIIPNQLPDQSAVVISDSEPQPDLRLGSNNDLNKLKDRIKPFDVKLRGQKLSLWQGTIRGLINQFELIDKNKPINRVIKYNNYTQIYDENSIYPVFSRAYFKLWEILVDTQILDKYKEKPINIANLAEGPGGFIQCLLDFRNRQHHREWITDRYNTITLKSTTKVKTLDWDNYFDGKNYFDKVIQKGYQINRSYGLHQDGDLTNIENIEYFSNEIGENKCQLITGDGGISLEDEEYGRQELLNTTIFLSEILTALYNQAEGGSFILKIYEMYYDLTIQLIHILTLYYTGLIIIKPKTSRPANSEKYLVCTGFRGINADELKEITNRFGYWIDYEKNKKDNKHVVKLFTFLEKEESLFIRSIIDFNKYNADLQMSKLDEGLEIANKKIYEEKDFMTKHDQEKITIGKEWCKKYQLPYIK